MTMDVGDRLRSVRGGYGLNQEEMAERVGMGAASWKRLELENRAPKGEVLEQLARDGININWLLTGQGEMRGTAPPPLREAVLAEAIAIVEEWLAANHRVMEPQKKASVIGEIYAMAMDEGEEVSARTVGRILKLVV